MKRFQLLIVFAIVLVLTACVDEWAIEPDYSGLSVRYTEEGDCAFFYPSDWFLTEPADGVLLASEPNGDAEISLVREKNSKNLDSPEEYWKISREILVETYGDALTFVEDGKSTALGTEPAVRACYDLSQNGYTMRLSQICCPCGDYCYVLTCTTLADRHDDFLPALRNLTAAFIFIDESAPVTSDR